MTASRWLLGSLVLVGASALLADGPGDNIAEKVRPVPPPGVKIAAGDRQELETGVAALGKEIADLRIALASKPALLELLPDVQIYHNAVRYALANDEFYNLNEVAVARKFLTQGTERAKELREGKSSWTTKTGLVVRGYVSKIDGSVQPYGLVVPKEYAEGDERDHDSIVARAEAERQPLFGFLDPVVPRRRVRINHPRVVRSF